MAALRDIPIIRPMVISSDRSRVPVNQGAQAGRGWEDDALRLMAPAACATFERSTVVRLGIRAMAAAVRSRATWRPPCPLVPNGCLWDRS